MFSTIPNNPFPPSTLNEGDGGSYVLPVANAETLGGVKVGAGLSIVNGVLSADAQLPNFSTDEQKTGRKWIDGKDIYFRTFDLGSDVSISQNTWVDMSSHVSITGWDKPVGVAFGASTEGVCLPLGVATNAGYLEIKVDITSVMRYLTFYYTKTESEG